jgi:flavin reductase (DIM6/NTAB) family NADH-FMN oxidoreductase RutF
MHKAIDLKVLYFGTPVVLISSLNPDGTPNIAPMSSAWWLGQTAMLGLGTSSQTAQNLLREKECVLNLAPSTLVDAVDRLAMTTGTPVVPQYKADMGYRYEPDKFGTARLTALPSEIVRAPRIAECPIQLECEVIDSHPFGRTSAVAIQAGVVKAHIEDNLIIPGTHYVDPAGWDPLIMKFCEFFGGGQNVYPSRLAEGWRMPHPAAMGRSAI